eukprot:3678476-Pleurochrysis_carterae.AAC.1
MEVACMAPGPDTGVLQLSVPGVLFSVGCAGPTAMSLAKSTFAASLVSRVPPAGEEHSTNTRH